MNAKNSFIPSMALYFLTGSKNKFAEIKAVLPQVEQLERDLTEIQELDPHKIIAAKLFEARTHHGNSFIVEPRGTSDFGWDPIFMPEGQQKTFAEMSPGEKGKISPRGAAIRKLKEALSSTF